MNFNIFQWRSLKTRVAILTLAIFLIGMWSLTFYASRMLHEDMERVLGEEQFSTVSFIAAEVNAELEARVEALKTIAARITPAMISNPTTLQTILEDQPIFYSLFNNGVAAAGLDGTVIAEFPRLPGRLGANFKERDYIFGPLKEGKVTIGRPVMSKLMHAPAFVIGVPIRGTQGKVIGVIAGVTDLRLPNFLDRVTENRFGKTGGYLLVAPQHRLIVTATNKSRIMEASPAPGAFPLIDRFMQGYEGTGILINPLGVQVLQSAKGIPVAGWYVAAQLPTEEAFAPIHDMLIRVQLAAVFLTLLLGGLLWWMLRRQLAPMFATLKALTTLSDTKTPLAISRQDEIGELIGGFNRLLGTLRQREEALRESEEQHRELAELLPETIFETDIQGTLTFVNRNAFDRFGYTQEDFTGGLNALTMVTPDGQGRAFENIQRIMNGETIGSNEFTMQRKDGSTFPSTIHSTTIMHDGKPVGLRGIIVDITERKRAEETLTESEKRLKLVTDNVPALIGYVDKNYRYQFVNKNYEKWFGLKQEAMIGKSIKDLLPTEAYDTSLPFVNRALAGEEVSFEGTVRLPDSTTKIFNNHLVPDRSSNNEVKGYYVLVSDITERKRAEGKLIYIMKAVESASDAIGISDSLGHHFYQNKALSELFGYTTAEELEAAGGGSVVVKDQEVAKKMFDNIMHGKSWVGELEMVTKSGRVFSAFERADAIKDNEGKLIGLIGIITDITDRKRAEEERRSLEERLQRAEKMEALGQLAGGVAHDLNNVLGILSGYSELLLEEIPEGHRSRGHVEKILQSTVKGAAIIQDLLTLARRGVTVSDVINLNNVVSGFLKTPVFEKMKDYHPRVTFRTECDKNILNIKGSPVHLEKTLMNLVSNAAESISGKGEVTIRTESRYLDKPLLGYDEVKEGDYAALTVSDTGMGIPAENREKIFEPFYTKKTMGRSGTGLGLAIVWGTVKDHNGYIDVQSEVGEGTAFTLYFPVTREELTEQQQKAPIEQYMGNGESVLVVDDVAEQRDIATELLAKLGYVVHAVSGGEEAVEYLKGSKADILVLDMIMAPGIDGLETYQRVLEVNPKQKAIIASGFSETDRVRAAQKLGAGAYVKKPYIMEKIGVAIRDELTR